MTKTDDAQIEQIFHSYSYFLSWSCRHRSTKGRKDLAKGEKSSWQRCGERTEKKIGKRLLILNPSIDELLIMNSNYYKIENKEDR